MRLTICTPASILVCCVLVSVTGGEARSYGAPDTDPDAMIERFLTSAEPPLTSYHAVRTLEAETRGGQMRARLTAWTSLDPVLGFQYSIIDETGSGIVREKVLHAALDAERSLRANGEARRGALTASNYDFTPGGDAGEGLMRVAIHPKRRDKLLVEGSILLAVPDGELVRVEGFLIKRPSLWTRDVHVVRRYARIGGTRVPVSMQSTARVLIAGKSTFSMLYEYTSVNGIPVSTAATELIDHASRRSNPCHESGDEQQGAHVRQRAVLEAHARVRLQGKQDRAGRRCHVQWVIQ
jgi:hypothetical protein